MGAAVAKFLACVVVLLVPPRNARALCCRGGNAPRRARLRPENGRKCYVVALNVVITGGNRGLGYALADEMLRRGHRVVLGCRDVALGREAAATLARAHVVQKGRPSPVAVKLDVTDGVSVAGFFEEAILSQGGGRVDVLFNNAAVCFEGRDKGTFERTFATNFFGALRMMNACVEATQWHSNDGEEAGRQSIKGCHASISNVSSGDGELCYLSSALRKRFEEAASLEDVTAAVNDLLTDFDERQEHAFGPTPAYSVSKAALNAAVRLAGPALLTRRGVAVTAVCPGDVNTRMCSAVAPEASPAVPVSAAAAAVAAAAGEIGKAASAGVLSAAQAARFVADVGLRPTVYPPGRFYRFGREIPW
ncbi:unnamed protein product [Phaeothamnion confervicola]